MTTRRSFWYCEKLPEYETDEYIMPGGILTESSDQECLRNEIDEELDCNINLPSLVFVGEYYGTAAGFEDRDVSMRLYSGKLVGVPRPCWEIEYLHWIGKEDASNPRVSSIVRNQIIPDLVARKILK